MADAPADDRSHPKPHHQHGGQAGQQAQVFQTHLPDDVAAIDECQRRHSVPDVPGKLHYNGRQLQIQHQHQNGEDDPQNGRLAQQVFEKAQHRGSGAFGSAGALNEHNAQRLEETGVSQVIDHHIGEAFVPKELLTYGQANKQRVGQAGHDHKDAPAGAGQVQKLSQSRSQQQGDRHTKDSGNQHKARLNQHVMTEIGKQSGNTGAGHSNVDDVLA